MRTAGERPAHMIQSSAEKENILRFKRERIFSRNCFVMGEIISQSYNFLFIEQFVNNVFVESAKGYSGAHRVQWRKGKYLHEQT